MSAELDTSDLLVPGVGGGLLSDSANLPTDELKTPIVFQEGENLLQEELKDTKTDLEESVVVVTHY
jgi:hypothetical protein